MKFRNPIDTIINRAKESELIKGFLSSAIWGVLTKVIMVVVTFYCSNTLAPEGFGEFSFIKETLNLVLAICAVNFSTLTVKLAAESMTVENSLRRLYLLFIFTIVVTLLLAFIVIVLPYDVLYSFTKGENVAYFVRVSALLLPFFIIQPLVSAVFRGYKQFNLVGIYETASSILFLLFVIIGVKIADYQGAIWAMLGYYFVFSLSGLLILFKYNQKTHYLVKVKNISSQRKTIYTMIAPIFLTSFIEAPLVWIAQAEIGRRASYALVGALSVMLTIRYLIQIVPTYFYQSFVPHVTILNAEQKYRSYFVKFEQVTKALLVLAVVVGPILIIFGKFFLGLFNKAYVDYYDSYLWSIAVVPFLLLSTLFKINLMIREHQVSIMIMTILSSLLFIGSFYLFAEFCDNILYAFFYAQAFQFGCQLMYSLKIYFSEKFKLISKSA